MMYVLLVWGEYDKPGLSPKLINRVYFSNHQESDFFIVYY